MSLLEVLDYYGFYFYLISDSLRLTLSFPQLPELENIPIPENIRDTLIGSLATCRDSCQRVGLRMSVMAIEELLSQPADKFTHRYCRERNQELQRRIRDELRTVYFLHVPDEKICYARPDWLAKSEIDSAFPSALAEFQKAGRCYAYDESTACMFHLMRVIDFGLRIVAESLGVAYEARNWMGIGNAIQTKMEAKYKDKLEDWKKVEPIYAEVLTDIQAISRGHRNPVLHELEKKYEGKEALYMLTVVEGFMSHLAKHGFREKIPNTDSTLQP
ncbi:MAG: hypothetical protein ACR2JB_18970 [Bryobacteraceae bacterium]